MRVIRLLERVVGVAGAFAAVLLVPLVLATCYEVYSRYVLGQPTVWAYEVGYILTGSHFLLGLAYTLRAGEHIRIDVFSSRFSAQTRARLDALAYCVVLPLLIWLAWALMNYLIAGYARNERSGQSALNMPVWPFRVVFFLSAALFTLQAGAEMLKAVARIAKPEKSANPANPAKPVTLAKTANPVTPPTSVEPVEPVESTAYAPATGH